jgi:three-Cys-motif partner protein
LDRDKLEAVVEYLKMYTTALSPRGFDLWYIDGFAGTGERTQTRVEGGLMGQPPEVRTEVFAGSAKRALDVRPPFRRFVFIEKLRCRCDALERLKRHHPERDISVVRGDANEVLKQMMAREPRSLKDKGPARGVVFLDPYVMNVHWDTLRVLAETQALDVWYLFPLQAVLRNLAHDPDKIGSEDALDRTLGREWRELSGDRRPMSGRTGACCARTARGHAAAPPRSVMNSRRFIPTPRREAVGDASAFHVFKDSTRRCGTRCCAAGFQFNLCRLRVLAV